MKFKIRMTRYSVSHMNLELEAEDWGKARDMAYDIIASSGDEEWEDYETTDIDADVEEVDEDDEEE